MTHLNLLFAQVQDMPIEMQDRPNGAVIAIFWLILLAFIAFAVAVHWKIFTKAGKPGWACLIPIYNAVVLCEIVGRPIWWAILLYVPCIQLFFGIVVTLDLARKFGQSTLFAVGMLFLPIIFYPILAFGDAQYHPEA